MEFRLRRPFAAALLPTVAFSLAINLLLFASPLYMMQIYDRVLSSRSGSTLLSLSVIVVFLLLLVGAFELIRSRILVRAGLRFNETIAKPLFQAVNQVERRNPRSGSGQFLRDADVIREFATGSGFISFCDAPWAPLFIAMCWLLHPWLGMTALSGAVVLFALAVLNETSTRRLVADGTAAANLSMNEAAATLQNAESIRALGMLGSMLGRWLSSREAMVGKQALASDRAGGILAASKFTRQLLQMAILGLGAWLAINQEISPGVMIAASILMGRALAPVELVVANWKGFIAARSAYGRIRRLLEESGDAKALADLPSPLGHLTVDNVTVIPPGGTRPTLRDVTFEVAPGNVVAIVGPSAAGKSTLIRAITRGGCTGKDGLVMGKRSEAIISSDHRPFARAGYALMVFGVGGFVLWSATAEIASAVIAPGTVSVISNRKTVQHLEGGIVDEILVRDGSKVKEGDVLLRLGQTSAKAALEVLVSQLDAGTSQESRLAAERDGATSIVFTPELLSRKTEPTVRDLLDSQRRLFEARTQSASRQIEMLDSRIGSLRKRAEAYGRQIGNLTAEIASFREQRKGVTSLASQGFASRNSERELDRRILSIETGVSEAEAEIASAESGIAEAELEKVMVGYRLREEAMKELAGVRETNAGLVERIGVARDGQGMRTFGIHDDEADLGTRIRGSTGNLYRAPQGAWTCPTGRTNDLHPAERPRPATGEQAIRGEGDPEEIPGAAYAFRSRSSVRCCERRGRGPPSADDPDATSGEADRDLVERREGPGDPIEGV